MVRDSLIKTTQTLFEGFTKATMQMTRDADLVVASVLKPMRTKFFSKGWGPPGRVLDMCSMAIDKKLQLDKYSPLGQESITWLTTESSDSTEWIQVLEGKFRSPVAHLLGPDSETAHFELVLPRRSFVNRHTSKFIPQSDSNIAVDSVFSKIVRQSLEPMLQGPASSHQESQYRIRAALEEA